MIVKPALTPEEWDREAWVRPSGQPLYVKTAGGANVEILEIGDDGPGWQLFNEERHPVAALALWRTRFGFTWQDVDECETQAAECRVDFERTGEVSAHEAQLRWESRAARIAALLPPRP